MCIHLLLSPVNSVPLQPSDSTEVLYDAKVQLSRQAMAEIQTLLDGDERWRTGALDNVLYDLRPHDYEAWKWRFEDTFGVELDTILKVSSSSASFGQIAEDHNVLSCASPVLRSVCLSWSRW